MAETIGKKYRLEQWFDFRRRTAEFQKAAACKHPSIREIAINYAQRMNDAIELPSVIMWAFAEGDWEGRREMAAWHKVWGDAQKLPAKDADFPNQVRRYKTILTRLRNGKMFIPGVQEGVAIGKQQIGRLFFSTVGQIEPLMYSQVVLAWGAFETLAGDLWEEAVNLCPNRLAGESHAITLKDIRRVAPPSDPLNLTGKVGSAIAANRNFTRLESIRQNFCDTFNKKNPGKINQILASNSLDALSCVRNIIVHRGGKMDSKYSEAYKKARAILPRPNGTFKPNGRIIERLIAPVRDCGTELFGAIDLWLTRHVKPRHANSQVAISAPRITVP